MKVEFLKIKSNQAGISTLEILIALALITTSVTSTMVVIFGNQSVSVDNQTNSEALSKAQALLETKRALARDDFNSVNSEGWALDTLGQPYYKEFKVSDISPCLKEVSSIYDWDVDNNRHSTISITTELSSTSTLAALAGDCATSPPPGPPPGFPPPGDPWSYPKYLGPGFKIPSSQAVDLDVANKFVFFVNNEPELVIIDATDEANPIEISSKETEGFGYSSIDVAGDLAYIADFKESATDPNEYYYRILIIDLDSTNSFSNPSILAYKNLAGVGLIDNNEAKKIEWQPKIYYYDGKVYIGTHEVSGPELHIFDVSNPLDPSYPNEIASFNLNYNINDIVVRDGLAYLATSNNNNELMVIDINQVSPNYLQIVDTFNAENTADAISLHLSGNKLYLGRVGTNNPNNYNLYIIDITDYSLISSKDILDTNSGQRLDINDMLVVGSFLFMATDDANEEFQVWDATDLTKLSSYDCFTGHTPNVMSSIDYENGYIYAAFRSMTDIQIFEPNSDPDSC